MGKGQFYESLVRLYLRLNGYFQSGLISHSDEWGSNAAELDAIAVRFPMHQQPERLVSLCPILNSGNAALDIVISEVKTSKVEFNPSLKNGHKLADRNWSQILNWVGLFDPQEIIKLLPILKTTASNNVSNLIGIDAKSIYGNLKIKPAIFSMESPISKNNPKEYINGEEVIDYLWLCLCPSLKRADCSTKYPLSNWGLEFEPIVKFLKDRNDAGAGKPSLKDFETKFNLV